MDERDILRTELRWAAVSGVAIVIVLAVIIGSSAAMLLHPPSNVEPIDPATLHAAGEFIDDNLGTSVGPDGAVTARIVAAQFAFVPRCVAVPADRPVTFRITSPDVIHGLLIAGTNVNTMVVPGYVSQVTTVFDQPGDHVMPCHEFCGLGHGEMWGVIRVVPAAEWQPDENGRVACASPG